MSETSPPYTSYRREPRWTLQLTFKNEMGTNYHMAIDIHHYIAREFQQIKPPPRDDIERMLNPMSFADVCEVIKTRQFRKDLFVQEATRLGQLLAERMEDKEGWHGENRAEALEDWGKP